MADSQREGQVGELGNANLGLKNAKFQNCVTQKACISQVVDRQVERCFLREKWSKKDAGKTQFFGLRFQNPKAARTRPETARRFPTGFA